MTKNISAFLPTLSITQNYLPVKNQNAILKIIKLAAFLLALPFLLLSDLLYSLFSHRSAVLEKPSKQPELPPPPPVIFLSKPDPVPSATPEPKPTHPLAIPEDPKPAPIEPPAPEPTPAPIETPAPPTPTPVPIETPPPPEPKPEPIPPADVIVPPAPQPSFLSNRIMGTALGLLGAGAAAYLIQSLRQSDPPPVEDLGEQCPVPVAESFSLEQCLQRSCTSEFNAPHCTSERPPLLLESSWTPPKNQCPVPVAESFSLEQCLQRSCTSEFNVSHCTPERPPLLLESSWIPPKDQCPVPVAESFSLEQCLQRSCTSEFNAPHCTSERPPLLLESSWTKDQGSVPVAESFSLEQCLQRSCTSEFNVSHCTPEIEPKSPLPLTLFTPLASEGFCPRIGQDDNTSWRPKLEPEKAPTQNVLPVETSSSWIPFLLGAPAAAAALYFLFSGNEEEPPAPLPVLSLDPSSPSVGGGGSALPPPFMLNSSPPSDGGGSAPPSWTPAQQPVSVSGKSLVPHQQLGIEEDFDRALQKAPQEPDGSQTFKVGGSTINLDRQTLLRFQKELNAGDLSFLDKPIPYVRLTSDGLPGPKEWITPREFLRALRPSRDEKRPYPKIQEWLRDLSKRDSEETLVFGLYKNTAMQVRAGVLYAAIERYSHERSEDQWIRCDYIEDLSNRSRIDPGGFEVQVFQFLEEYSPEIRDSRQNRALPPKPRQAAISTQLDTPSSQLSPLALPEPRVPDKRVEDMVQALENLLREASQAPDGYARIPYRLLTPSANDPWHPILRLDLKSLEKLLDHVRREDFQSLDKQYSFDFEHPDRPSETPRYPITPLAFLKDLVLHPPSALESWIQELSQESYREFVLEDAEYSSMLINTAELSYYLHALRNSTLQQEPRIRCFCELKSPKDPSNPYVPADFELSWFLKAFPNPAQCPSPSGSIWSLSRQWVKTLEDLSREDCWFNTSDLQALASNHSPKSISSIAIDRKALLEQFGIYRNAPQQGIFSIECPCNLYPEDGSKPIPGTVGLFWLMAKNPDFLSNPSVDEPQDPNQEKLDRIAKGVQFADLPESSKEKQKAPEPAHSSSSSPLSVLDRFLQEPSNPQQPQRTISLKARVSNLVEKKSIWLPSSVRSKIINGSAGFIPPSRYHSDPVFKRTGGFRLVPEEDHPQINPETLPWNFTKLFADLESMLPSISQGTKIFASVDELLAAFGTSRETLISPIQSQEEKIQHDKLVSTLCCLTKAASKSCFDQLKEKLKEVKAGHGKIGFGQEPKPHIHIKVKEGITTIEICSDFELNDPQKDSGKLPFTAVLTLSGQHNNHFRLKPQSPNAFASSARLDMSFIGGGEALFNWHKSKFTAEDEALQSFIPPLEDPKPLSWRAWYDSWVNKASTTAIKWTDYLSHALFHQPHLAQDHKYRLALNTQIAALNAWLAKTLPHNNEPKDLKRNLLLAYRGQTLEPAYQTLFGPRCANSPLVDHVINALESLQDETLPIRIRNSTYLAHLRGALKSDDYKVNHPDFADIQALLRDLCWQRFTGNRMEQYESALIEFAIEGTPSKLFSSTIANAIALGNEELELCSPTLKKAPQDGAWQKFCNSFGLFSDPIGKSNVPELRSIHAVKRGDEIYPVLCLRHGTPTYQPTSLSLEEIVPEYRGFLDAAKERLKHVLYVNHQKMWPSWNPEEQAEYHRACTINALERDYPGTFHFLSLPLDGKIWSKSMLQSENTSDWKKEVVNALVNEQHGFKLPAGFLTEETKEEKKAYFIHLADKLHSLYFGDLDSIELSTKKRKIFLNIFYSYVKEVMKAHYKIELMASPCKDYKDRGNASTGIDESLMNLRLGLENENEELQKLYVRTLAPFTIKYEGILEKRLELLTDVLTHIGNLRQSDKEQIKRFNPKPGYSLYEDVNSLELPPSLHTDTASAIPLHQIEFPSFTEYLQTAIAKAGTVLLPTAVSNVLYGGPDPLRDSTTFAWNRNALEQALQYTVQIDGSQCSSIQDIAKALKMSPDTLFTKREGETDREFHSRMARLTWLSDRALMLCQEGLSEFLKNTSPYPLDQIVCKPASYPAFSSKREGASGWTNRIEQDYVLRFSQHEYVVRVVAVTNSRKKTKVTIYPR